MGDADAIVPDDKDWTWVLDETCPECGYVAAAVEVDDVAAMVRANAARWAGVLAAPDVATRPRPGTWSALEYGCHVRDVFRLFDTRLHLMLDAGPAGAAFANWDQDVTAVQEAYDTQGPAAVAAELAEAAEVVAASFAAVTPDQHDSIGLRSDGARFTVTSFARYFVHDPVHHLWDVTGETAAAQAAASGPAPA